MILLDTDIIIALLKGESNAVLKIEKFSEDKIQLCTSSINAFEILSSIGHEKISEQVLSALKSLKILEFDFDCAQKTAEICAHLKTSNKSEIHRVMTASSAIVNGCTLVTRETRNYEGIPNLKIETW